MTVTRYTGDDPLFRMADQVPLGRYLGIVAVTDEMLSGLDMRPFGLRFATSAVASIPVEPCRLRYDQRRQITVDDLGAPVFGRHSTGKTSTRTSDGHKSMDSDTDHTED
ncbi:MAG: putative ATP-grasp-modified RiPP [Pseudonocardiales bacterium]